jgi:hypothetical protein
MYQASTIESVALTRCALTLAQLGALVPVIKRCARLRGVDVSDNRLGESRDAADWERLAEMVEVRVIVDPPMRRIEGPDHITAECICPDLEDGTVIDGEHWRPFAGHNVDRVMYPGTVASREKTVGNLSRRHPLNGNRESAAPQRFKRTIAPPRRRLQFLSGRRDDRHGGFSRRLGKWRHRRERAQRRGAGHGRHAKKGRVARGGPHRALLWGCG